MLNNCLLTGNLAADPEVFYSSEGDPIATLTWPSGHQRKRPIGSRSPVSTSLLKLQKSIFIKALALASSGPSTSRNGKQTRDFRGAAFN